MAPLLVGVPNPSAPPPPMPYSPYPPPPTGPWGAASFGPSDEVALSHVTTAVILGLVGIVLSLVVEFASPVVSIFDVTTVGSGSSVSLSPSALLLVGTLLTVGVALTMAELWFYRRAFLALAGGDPRFRTPSRLVLLALISIAIVVVAAFGFFAIVYQAVVCSGAGNPISTVCVNVGALLAFLVVLLCCVVGLVVGYIGLLVGIWRLGTRYGEDMFKVGAVLLIFPVLNFVGAILILVAARSAAARLPSRGGVPGPTW